MRKSTIAVAAATILSAASVLVGVAPAYAAGPNVTSTSDVSAAEGSAAVFTVTLASATTSTATATLQLKGVTATSGSDYAATPQYSVDGGTTYQNVGVVGAITIPAGKTSFKVRVPHLADTVSEGSETYNLYVYPGTGLGSATGWGVGTITNVVPLGPNITGVGDVGAKEGSAAVFPVTLASATTSTATATLQLKGVTATSGSDYTAKPQYSVDGGTTYQTAGSGGAITIPAGKTSFQVRVTLLTDSVNEGSETYNLYVYPGTGLGSATGWGIGTITNVTPPATTCPNNQAQVYPIGNPGQTAYGDSGRVVTLKLRFCGKPLTKNSKPYIHLYQGSTLVSSVSNHYGVIPTAAPNWTGYLEYSYQAVLVQEVGSDANSASSYVPVPNNRTYTIVMGLHESTDPWTYRLTASETGTATPKFNADQYAVGTLVVSNATPLQPSQYGTDVNNDQILDGVTEKSLTWGGNNPYNILGTPWN